MDLDTGEPISSLEELKKKKFWDSRCWNASDSCRKFAIKFLETRSLKIEECEMDINKCCYYDMEISDMGSTNDFYNLDTGYTNAFSTAYRHGLHCESHKFCARNTSSFLMYAEWLDNPRRDIISENFNRKTKYCKHIIETYHREITLIKYFNLEEVSELHLSTHELTLEILRVGPDRYYDKVIEFYNKFINLFDRSRMDEESKRYIDKILTVVTDSKYLDLDDLTIHDHPDWKKYYVDFTLRIFGDNVDLFQNIRRLIYSLCRASNEFIAKEKCNILIHLRRLTLPHLLIDIDTIEKLPMPQARKRNFVDPVLGFCGDDVSVFRYLKKGILEQLRNRIVLTGLYDFYYLSTINKWDEIINLSETLNEEIFLDTDELGRVNDVDIEVKKIIDNRMFLCGDNEEMFNITLSIIQSNKWIYMEDGYYFNLDTSRITAKVDIESKFIDKDFSVFGNDLTKYHLFCRIVIIHLLSKYNLKNASTIESYLDTDTNRYYSLKNLPTKKYNDHEIKLCGDDYNKFRLTRLLNLVYFSKTEEPIDLLPNDVEKVSSVIDGPLISFSDDSQEDESEEGSENDSLEDLLEIPQKIPSSTEMGTEHSVPVNPYEYYQGGCVHQFSKGKRKGEYCGEPNLPGSPLCTKCNKLKTASKYMNRCVYKIQRGENKGKICGEAVVLGAPLCARCIKLKSAKNYMDDVSLLSMKARMSDLSRLDDLKLSSRKEAAEKKAAEKLDDSPSSWEQIEREPDPPLPPMPPDPMDESLPRENPTIHVAHFRGRDSGMFIEYVTNFIIVNPMEGGNIVAYFDGENFKPLTFEQRRKAEELNIPYDAGYLFKRSEGGKMSQLVTPVSSTPSGPVPSGSPVSSPPSDPVPSVSSPPSDPVPSGPPVSSNPVPPVSSNLSDLTITKESITPSRYLSAWSRVEIEYFLNLDTMRKVKPKTALKKPLHDGELRICGSDADLFMKIQGEIRRYLATNPVPGTEIAAPKLPRKKQSIPPALKEKVWRSIFGNTITEKCYCCRFNEIKITSFAAGHIIAEVNGGTVTVENIRPICNSCNSSMGSTHMFRYMKEKAGYTGWKHLLEEDPLGAFLGINDFHADMNFFDFYNQYEGWCRKEGAGVYPPYILRNLLNGHGCLSEEVVSFPK